MESYKLQALNGLCFPEGRGRSFLMHVQQDQKPSCIAVLPDGNDRWLVVSGMKGVLVSQREFVQRFEDAIDQNMVVTLMYTDRPGGAKP